MTIRKSIRRFLCWHIYGLNVVFQTSVFAVGVSVGYLIAKGMGL